VISAARSLNPIRMAALESAVLAHRNDFRLPLAHINESGVYSANHDARARVTKLESAY
jgi:hypothetical protein